MALTRQDFQNIPSSGLIPADRLPGSQFAVGYAFTYTGTPSLTKFDHTFSGKLVLYFYDALGIVNYVITIEETFNLFIFPLAPGLVLYTWNWVPSAEKISGRKGESPDAVPTETLGLGSFGVDPDEGSGTTNYEVIIDSRFYSGIFTEPLEIGDSVKIKFHNLSAGFVTDRASLSLAIERGLAGLAATIDRINGLLCASNGINSKYLQTGRSWHAYKHRETGHGIPGTEPSVVELSDGREIIGCRMPNGQYVEYVSRNAEWKWERALYPDKTRGYGTAQDVIWVKEFTMPALVAFGKTRIAIAINSGVLYARRITDESGPGELRRVLAVDPKQTYTLVVDGAGVFWIVDLSALAVAVSRNDGVTWEAIPKDSAQ